MRLAWVRPVHQPAVVVRRPSRNRARASPGVKLPGLLCMTPPGALTSDVDDLMSIDGSFNDPRPAGGLLREDVLPREGGRDAFEGRAHRGTWRGMSGEGACRLRMRPSRTEDVHRRCR